MYHFWNEDKAMFRWYPIFHILTCLFNNERFEKGSSKAPYNFELNSVSDNIKFHLITPCSIEFIEEDNILLETKDGEKSYIGFNNDQIKAYNECIEINDNNLKKIWGGNLYRIVFKTKRPVSKGMYKIKITR